MKIKGTYTINYTIELSDILKFGALKMPLIESFSKTDFNKFFKSIIKFYIESALSDGSCDVFNYVLLELFDNDYLIPNDKFIHLFNKMDIYSLYNKQAEFKILWNSSLNTENEYRSKFY